MFNNVIKVAKILINKKKDFADFAKSFFIFYSSSLAK